jgi:ATP-dependent Lon protease
MAVRGGMNLGRSLISAETLLMCLQGACNAGAKGIPLPMTHVDDIPSIPGRFLAKLQVSLYADPVDTVFNGLGSDP